MTEKNELIEEEGKYLLRVARKTIERELFPGKDLKESDTDLPAIFHEKRGTFVTLTIEGNLRGCIGHIIPQESLIEGIMVNAINAAKLRHIFHNNVGAVDQQFLCIFLAGHTEDQTEIPFPASLHTAHGIFHDNRKVVIHTQVIAGSSENIGFRFALKTKFNRNDTVNPGFEEFQQSRSLQDRLAIFT